jgi:hypothetical protein
LNFSTQEYYYHENDNEIIWNVISYYIEMLNSNLEAKYSILFKKLYLFVLFAAMDEDEKKLHKELILNALEYKLNARGTEVSLY